MVADAQPGGGMVGATRYTKSSGAVSCLGGRRCCSFARRADRKTPPFHPARLVCMWRHEAQDGRRDRDRDRPTSRERVRDRDRDRTAERSAGDTSPTFPVRFCHPPARTRTTRGAAATRPTRRCLGWVGGWVGVWLVSAAARRMGGSGRGAWGLSRRGRRFLISNCRCGCLVSSAVCRLPSAVCVRVSLGTVARGTDTLWWWWFSV